LLFPASEKNSILLEKTDVYFSSFQQKGCRSGIDHHHFNILSYFNNIKKLILMDLLISENLYGF